MARPEDTIRESGETQTVPEIPSRREATQDTRVSRPGESGPESASESDPALMTSPAHAMLLAEVARTRAFMRSGWGLGAVGIAALPLLRGDPVARWTFTGAIVVAIAYGMVLGSFAIRRDSVTASCSGSR